MSAAGGPAQPAPAQQYIPWGPPLAAPPRNGAGSVLGPVIVLAVGALAALGYAIWSIVARRGIFTDFADGTSTLTVDDAKSSDTIDMVFLIVAGGLVMAGLVWWLLLKVGGRTDGGPLDLAGLVIGGLGIAAAVVGLVLSAGVDGTGSQADEGDKAATAALVSGVGFFVVAVGLVLGVLAVRAAKGTSTPSSSPNPYASW